MAAMKGRLIWAVALAALVPAALTACGGATTTVTAGSQPVTQTQTGTSSDTTTTSTAPSGGSGNTGGETGTSTSSPSTTSSQTRTASEPQFAQGQNSSQEAQQAAAVLQARGYTPADLSEYHPNQTLKALVGTRSGSADGYGQQVFFFVDDRFIGTDAKEPSASLKIVSQGETEATWPTGCTARATP